MPPPDRARWDGRRCPWAEADPLLASYHDTERGRFPSGEPGLFEALSLDILQAGLSWREILARRDELRTAFAGFDADVLAGYDEADVGRLCRQLGLPCHRTRVRAVTQNARRLLVARSEWGSGSDDREAFGRWLKATPPGEVTAELIQRFRVVTATGVRNFMEAIGLIPLGHAPDCWRARAIVFDLDGVLVDSQGWWHEACAELVSEAGGTWTAEDGAAVTGRDSREAGKVIVARRGLDGDPDAAAAEVARRMVALYRERGAPHIDGAADAVRAFASRHPVAVASSAHPDVIQAALEATGLAGTFEVVVSSDEVAAGKPAPDVYLMAARLLALRPADCLAVEDSAAGVLAARAAGMPVALVPNPSVPPAPEAWEAATVVVPRLALLDADAIIGAWAATNGRHHQTGPGSDAMRQSPATCAKDRPDRSTSTVVEDA